MQNDLKIRFVTEKEFTSLVGVDPKSTKTFPNKINDPNLVGGYETSDAIVKSQDQGNLDQPSYTTRAQACTAGFLRVRLGAKVHSHMMFHLWGVKIDGKDPVEKARREFPEQMKGFFNNLDDLIQLAQSHGEDIHIDYVFAGSIEHSEGDRPNGAPGPSLEEVKQTSKSVREIVEQTLAEHSLEFKTKAKQSGVAVTMSSSKITGQKSIMRPDLSHGAAYIPMTHIHYDAKNTLSISATQILQNFDGETHLNDDTSPEALAEHYGDIELSKDHLSVSHKAPADLIRTPKSSREQTSTLKI